MYRRDTHVIVIITVFTGRRMSGGREGWRKRGKQTDEIENGQIER